MNTIDRTLEKLERDNLHRINQRLREVRKLRQQVEALGKSKPGPNFLSMVVLGWRLG